MTSHAQDYECDVVTVTRDATCIDIADEMDLHVVGCVVVVDGAKPIGIVTDRDLVQRVVAADRDPEKTTAQDIMSQDLITAEEKDDIEGLLKEMQKRSIRRIPIVTDGQLSGLVSLDDLLVKLSSYLFNANRGILGGLQESRRTVPHRRRIEAREDALDEIRTHLSHLGEDARKATRARLRDLLDRF